MPRKRDETPNFGDNRADVLSGNRPQLWERHDMKKFLAAVAVATAATDRQPRLRRADQGAVAPDFSAQGMLGGKEFTFKLSDALKKGPVVVYFFPAAYTPGCTAETKLFADNADAFKAAGATLIGVTGGARLADGTMANAKDNLARLAEFSAEHCRDKFPIAAVDDRHDQGLQCRATAEAGLERPHLLRHRAGRQDHPVLHRRKSRRAHHQDARSGEGLEGLASGLNANPINIRRPAGNRGSVLFLTPSEAARIRKSPSTRARTC